MSVDIAIMISIISVSASVIFGIISQRRATSKDIEQKAHRDATMTASLDRIEKSTNDIKSEIKEVRAEVRQLDERVTLVEVKVGLNGKKD